MSGVFVTGSGTDVGKTFVTCGLIVALRARGGEVAALKPVLSGFSLDDVAASDSGHLLRALGTPLTPDALERISPWRFAAPLSPDMAAAREGRALDVDAVVAHSRAALAAHDGVLAIEGVGGVCVPLDATRTVADWIDALAIPVVLVGGTYLGALSHTLSALEVLRGRGRELAAIVLSESVVSAAPLEETRAVMTRYSHGVPVVGLARGAAGGAAFATLADRVLTASERART